MRCSNCDKWMGKDAKEQWCSPVCKEEIEFFIEFAERAMAEEETAN